MNNTEAKTFVEKLFNDVWTTANVENVSKYYGEELKGQVNATPITLNDIKNRVNYISKTQKNQKVTLKDVIAADDKISVRFEYNYVDTKNGQDKKANTIAVYQLNNKKITGVWMVSDEAIDYKAKA